MANYPERPQLRIHGNVVNDPEVRFIEKLGKQVVEFRLAVDVSPSRENKQTDFYQITVWSAGIHERVLAEVYKGARVAVSGSYSERSENGKTYKKIDAYQVGLIEFLTERPVQAPVAAAAASADDWD